jgi:hypothetical protein
MCGVMLRSTSHLSSLTAHVSRVTCEPLGTQIEATLNAIYHGLGDSNLHCALRARTCRIKDNPRLVVDQIVRVISEELGPRRVWLPMLLADR